MKYPFKKGISDNYSFLKKSRKVISILVVFLLLSTLLSTIVSSEGISSYLNNDADEPESLLEKFFKGKSIKERLQETKEKIQARISEIKNKIVKVDNDETVKTRTISRQPTGTSLLKTLRTIISIKNSDSPLMFHTNYNGISNSTKMRLFGKVNVDVNGDGLDDISARMLLYPFIERPLCLSIRFKLTITRLENFPDENEDFSAYAELTFLGILSEKQKGDTLGFGYVSPEDEEVPDKCVVTYKYLPHILSLKRPEHKAEIDPGASAGKDDLILFLQYTNYDGAEVSSQLVSTIVYNPAVKSEIHVWGTGLLGGSEYNFERTGSDNPNIDMYCSFTKNNTNIFGYVYDLPQKVTFNLDLGIDGFIDFDTHGEKVSEIGLNAELYDKDNKIYFEDLPSKARLEWNHDIIFGDKANFSFYTEGEGISFKVHLEPQRGGMFDFSISSNENLNCSAALDIEEGYLIIDKTNINISVSLSATGANNGIFQLSFNVSKDYINPFEIYFNLSEKIEVTFANKSFVLTDLNLLVDVSSLNFGIIADKFVKNHSGNITILIDHNMVGENVSLNFSFLLDNGVTVEIYGLKIGFNGNWTEFEQDPLILTTSWSFEFSFLLSAFEYYVAEDWSWGYFCFKGEISYETYYLFSVSGIDGGVIGTLFAGSNEEGFNISWYTDTSKGYNLTKLNITGVLFGLEDFHFYLGDLINFSISSLTGSLLVNEACNESGSVIFESIGSQTNLDVNFEFNFSTVQEPLKGGKNETGIRFFTSMEDFHIDLIESTFTFEFNWADDNTSNIIILADTNLNLSIGRFDLFLIIDGNETLIVQNMNGYIQGKSGIDIDIALPLNFAISNESTYFDFSEDTFAITLTDVDVYLSIDNLNIGIVEQLFENITMDLEDVLISASATGQTSISFVNFSLDIIKLDEETNLTTINVTFGLDAGTGNLDLKRFEIGNIQGILNFIFMLFQMEPIMPKIRFIIENISIVGYSELTIKAGIWVEYSIIPYIGFKFENEEDAYITMDKLSLIFYDIVEDLKEVFGLDLSTLLPEVIIENITVNPPTIFIRDVYLVEGVFDFVFMPVAFTFGIEIPDGSAIENVDIGLEIPGLLEISLRYDYPIDYIKVEYNLGWNSIDPPYNQYLLIDTHNTTSPVDLFVLLTPEFVNMGIDLFNLSIPYAEHNQGIWFDDIILQADEFYFYVNETVFGQIQGYLHIEAGGNIYLLINGSWEIIIYGEVFSFTVYPGHIQLIFHASVVDLPVDLEIPIGGGRKLIIFGEFTCPTINAVFDYWYNETESFQAIEKIEATVSGYLEIKNYRFSLLKPDAYENFTIDGESFTLSGEDIITGYIAFYNDANVGITELLNNPFSTSFAVGASAGVTIRLSNSKLTIQSGYAEGVDGAINVSIEIPDFSSTFGAGIDGIPSELIILLLMLRPFKIDPTNVKLEVGETQQFTAKNPPGGQDDVQWFSLDSSRVRINRTSGLAIGVNTTEQPVTISCVSAGVEPKPKNRAKVTVVLEKDFSIDPDNETIFINQTLQLTPDYHEDPVTWVSNKPEIATVNYSNGLVTGISEGVAIITATDGDGKKATAEITVISYPAETKFFLEGNVSFSGILQLGLYMNLDEQAIMFTILAKGDATLKNVYGKLIRPEDKGTIEFEIPNRLEIENGTIEWIKHNETSAAVLRWGGILSIIPGKSDFGKVGFGIRFIDTSKTITATLESLFLAASVGSQDTPDGGGVTPSDPRKSGTINFEFDPNNNECRVNTENDSISMSLTNLNVSIDQIKDNDETNLLICLESLQFNKLGKIRWVLDTGSEEGSLGGGDNSSGGFYFKFEHTANFNSSLNLKNLYIAKFKNGVKQWELPIIKRLNFSRFKQGHNIWIIEAKQGFINISHDKDSSWNCSIEIGWFFDQNLQGLWEFSSTMSVNSTFHIIPGYSLFGELDPTYIEWIIHEPGNYYHFEIKHTGGFTGKWSFEIGPIQLTAGKIVFKILKSVQDENQEGSQGFFYLDNQGVYGGGDLITFTMGKSFSATLGWFEIDHGTLNISWDTLGGDAFSWVNLDNDGMYPNFGLFKVNIGNIELELGNVSLRPGNTYMEWQKFSKSRYRYIENTANIDLKLFKIMFGIGEKFSLGFGSEIHMEPGKFELSCEESTHPDFDSEYVIKNGVFECEKLEFIIEKTVDNNVTETQFKLWDIDLINYTNTIVIQFRTRDGGAIPSAIYIDTTDYLNVSLWGVTVYRNGWKQFEISSFINLKFKFEEFYIGMFDGEFKRGGKIRPGIGINTGIFEFLISILFKGDGGVMQEVGVEGAFDLDLNTYPNTAAFSMDLTNCSQDIELSSGSLSIGDKYSISGSASFNANSYFTADLYTYMNPSKTYFGTNLSIDNGGTPVIGNLTLTLLNDETDNGFGLTVSGLQADGFWVLCAFEKGPLGMWWPDWDNMGSGGSLIYDGFVLSICVNGNWFDIPIGDIILVEIQGEETVLMQDVQSVEVEYTVVVYGGTAPYTYLWTLPNGSTSTGQTATCTFDTLGTFIISVEVVDNNGLIGTSSKVVEVVNTLYGTLAL